MDLSSKYPKHFASKISQHRTANQAIPSGVNTDVLFDTNDFDILNEYNVTTANAFHPRETGYYFITASGLMAGLNAGQTFFLQIQINGITTIADVRQESAQVGENITQNVSILRYLLNTDFIRVQVAHNVGVPHNLSGGNYTYLNVFRVG